VRVLHVSEVTTGGVAAVLRSVIPGQLAAGHDVTVCMPTRLDVVPPEAFVPWGAKRRIGAVPGAVAEVRRVVERVRPDAVHLHAFGAGCLGRWAFLGRRGPAYDAAVVYQPHAWNYGAARNPLSLAGLVAVEAGLGRLTDTLVVNCRAEAVEGRRHGVRAPASVIGLPIDLGRFSPTTPDHRAELRRRLSPDGRAMAVVVGEPSWQKGTDRLVRAWERAPVPGVELVLVGGYQPRRLHPLREAELQALAPTQWGTTIRAVGRQDDVRPWLWAAEVSLVASRYEAGCVALGEALACGTPVVATDFAGASEALLEGPEEPGGAVVTDMKRLLEGCARTVSDPAVRARQSAAARDRAERVFSPQAVLERLGAAYEQAVSQRRAAPSRRRLSRAS
jgi:glycosyltransferase involved in cell wall biosynthesis